MFQALPTSIAVFLRNQDPFLEDITMRCVCVFSGVPLNMVAALFHNLPTCAHEILRRGSSSAHRIMLRNILSRINKADLLYSINRWVEDMHTYTLPSHISHHAGDNNNANKSYPTKIIQFQPRGYEKHKNLQ